MIKNQNHWYIYTTGGNRSYPIEITCQVIKTREIYHDYQRITSLCRNGCKNFDLGGGCPPKAPKFENLSKDYPFAVIIYSKLDSIYKTSKVKKSNSPYIHFRSQDVILSKLLTLLGYNIKEKYKQDIYFLNNGYCMGCQKCNFKMGNTFCKNPNKRTFSMEATGIDVALTLEKLFGIKLQWYNKENYKDIECMIKAISILTRNDEQASIIAENLLNSLNELSSTKYKVGTAQHEIKLNELRNIDV